MSTKQNVVVLYSGSNISPFIKHLLDSRKVRFTIIANTLLDYKVSSDPNSKDTSVGGWIDSELIAIASSIIPDDLRQSPLASLFTMSKMINIVPLTPSKQFIATWLSDIRSDDETAPEKTNETFKTLSNYNSYPIDVYPLSYSQKSPISIKYRNQTGPPRVYQEYGYLDFQKRTEIDPDDLDSAINENKDFSIDGYNVKESIVPAEIEKIIKDADAIIISSDDFFSLALMLSYQDVRKSIKKSSGSVLAIAPVGSRFNMNQREQSLLRAFGFNPDVNGFLEIIKDVADTVCLDSGESEIATQAQEAGFNVVIEDLIKIENKTEYISLILKGAGLDVSGYNLDSAVEIKQITEAKSDSQPAKDEKASSKENKDEQQSTDSESSLKTKDESDVNVDDKKTVDNNETSTAKSNNVESKNKNDKIAKSVSIAKSVVKTTNDAKKEEKSSNFKEVGDQKDSDAQVSGPEEEKKVQPADGDEDEDEGETLEEKYNELISEIQDSKTDDLSKWHDEIQSYIEKDEGHAIKVANSLLTIIKETKKDKVRNNCIQAYLDISIDYKLQFKNSLLKWVVTHLNDPDFSIQNTQYDIIKKMINASNEKSMKVIGELLKSLIKELLTSSDMTPMKQERGRVLVLRTAFNNRILTKYAIQAFLDIFDDDKVSHANLWPGLSSFEARLVGIELVEGYTVAKSRLIADEANKKDLGSFSILLDEIIKNWEKGDMNQVISLCGSLSDSAIRKAKRLSLAQNIKKVGTIPLEILARSLKEDPKELETLVYEMVMNDDIHAKLEIVDGRLYILPIDEDKDEETIKKEIPSDVLEELASKTDDDDEAESSLADENNKKNSEEKEEDTKSE